MAWTTPRTWSDGELVTAAIMNQHVRDNLSVVPHLLVRKTSDETVASSTALQNDDVLVHAVSANTVWQYRWQLIHSSAGSGDMKIAFTVPAGATLRHTTFWLNVSNTATICKWDTSGTAVTLRSASVAVMDIVGTVAIAGTAGNVQLQWCQSTSDVSGTIVAANSTLFGMQLA